MKFNKAEFSPSISANKNFLYDSEKETEFKTIREIR